LVSTQLEPYIASCGFNLFNQHIHSVHRLFFVNFLLNVFFGHGTPRLARPDLRFVSSLSQDVTKFVTKMYSHLAENKIFHQYQEFCLDADIVAQPWKLANK
jgi:hypothetical protein